MAKLPVFTTERLILREVTEADAPAYEKNFDDYEVISQLASVVPCPYPAGGVLDYIRHQIVPRQGNDRWVWGILPKEQPSEIIGVVDLWRTGTPENRGFWLGPFAYNKSQKGGSQSQIAEADVSIDVSICIYLWRQRRTWYPDVM